MLVPVIPKIGTNFSELLFMTFFVLLQVDLLEFFDCSLPAVSSKAILKHLQS